MTILVVIMMIATALVPAAAVIGDEVASAATSNSSGVSNVNVSIITAESGDGGLSDLVYLGETLPTSSVVDPTKWVRDDPANGGTGFWYNINTQDVENYGKILTYGSLMYPSQIKNDIAAYFKDSGGNPLFTTANYQFVQISYTVDYACNVNVTISKDGNTLKSDNIAETNYAAGCYVQPKKQCVLYSIAADGDLRPDNERGTYNFTVKCEQKVIVYTGSKEYAASDVKLYGTVYDNNAQIVGQTANKVMNAIIYYEVLDSFGKTIRTGNTTMITDTSSAKYGKFYVAVPLGNMVKITNVTADGYSFTDHTFTSNPVTHDTDDVDTPISPGQQRSSPVFTADQFSSVIHVTDTASLGLSGIEVEAHWYYRVAGLGTSVFYKDTPPISSMTAGTVDFVGNTTDANGDIILTYTTPSSAVDVETKVYVFAKDTNAYRFVKQFISDEDLGKTLMMTSFPELTDNGNIYLDLSHTSSEVLRAEESSFTVSFSGQYDNDGYGGAPLEGVSITATWLYDVLDSSTGNRMITDDPNGKGLDVPVIGLAAPTTSKTDSSGRITVAYRSPVVGTGGTGINCYLYIASTSNIFTLDSIPYTELIGTFKSELPTLVAGKNGCTAIPLADIGPGQALTASQVTYNVGWTVNPSDPSKVPSYVKVTYYGEGWVESRTFDAYRNPGEAFIKFNTVVISGDAMHIDITSPGYTLTYNSWIGSIKSGTQQYTATASVATDPVVPTSTPGYLSGATYTVHGLSRGDSVTLTYMVGADKYSVIVPAKYDGSEYSAVHSVSGWPGLQSVKDVAASTDANVYLGAFVNGEVTAVKLVDKKLVAYSDDSSNPVPTIDNLKTNLVVQIYYNKNLYSEFTFGDSGTSVVSVPESGDVTYQFEGKQIVPKTQTDGVFLGYDALNFYGFVQESYEKVSMTINIKYVASSSLENLNESQTTEIVNPDPSEPISSVVKYGDTKSFTAPVIKGFTFSGWVINGDLVGNGASTCNITADKSMGDSITLYAVYGADSATSTPDNGFDRVIIAIGAITIIIAILVFVYVVFQSRRF